MDIEINNNKQQASFRNGKFYHTFTPSTANQTVKLYHMGCVGDTRLNRIQLEQGTEPTGFVEPKNTTNTISGIFKNLRDLDVLMKDPESDFWTRIKKTAKGTIEEYHTSKLSNEIVKTAEGIIEKQTKVIDTNVENKIIAETKKYSNELSSRITTLSNDSLRKDEISITNNGIQLGSGKVVDGRTISSILTTQPENIKAITDKFIITPANENLVDFEYRASAISNERDLWLTPKIQDVNLEQGAEFIFDGSVSTQSTNRHDIRFMIEIKTKDGRFRLYDTNLIGANTSSSFNGNATLRIPENITNIEYYRFGILQETRSNFSNVNIQLPKVYKKKSAELIVDGTIEGRQIKTETLETAHHKAGSITSEIIAANAVKAKHVLIDDGLIDNLVSHNAFISKLWAQEAFIDKINAIKVTATSIDTEQLKGKEIEGVTIKGGTIDASVITGETKIKIGEHGYMRPAGNGLRFCLPETDNANKGVGVQMLGNYGRGDSPCGLYVYKDPDFDTSETEETDSYLMTVKGYIKTKGINNLKFENHQDSSTSIGIWNKNVSLLFDNTDNDIYYVWKSKYSLWGIITQHYDTTSDVRLKKDIKKCEYNALDLIDDFNFKSFNWKYHEEFGQKPYTEIGLIAQDVEKINKNFVAMAGEYKTLNQFNLLTYSLKAIQELSTQNNELQQRIIKLEEIING